MADHIANFQLMAKPSGSVCNIDCSYCFYLEKELLYPERKSHWKMDGITLENYIRKNIQGQKADVVDFIWQGGEPTLLGIDFFREAIRLQNHYRGTKIINNSFQTNGTNIDDEWAVFLKENNFLVGLSIDGDRISNDTYRLTRAGKSTYNAVIKGLEALKRHQVEFNTLTVVNAENVKRPMDVYNFLKRIGSRYMQFIPLVERRAAVADENGLTLIQPDFSGQCSVTDWSVPAKAYGNFLNTIFDHWIMNDLGTVFVMNFEQTMAKMVGQTSACVINETCGGNLIVEANGDIYSCDHFVYPEHKLGNINHGDLTKIVNSPQNITFGQSKLKNISKDCMNCAVRSVCNGGCPKHRFNISSDGRPNKNYFCESFALHLHHSLPVMRHLLQLMRQSVSLSKIKKVIRTQHYQQKQNN
ncbi:anaerobic sulfatase maturase [Enterobacter sp. 10-1]|uniref:anaerobic sulfatase maturase n=1 Tax=Raoultella TaxID=160674 RepID=UPI000BA44E6C|nr:MULTISPECIES: anaerobic sulfatase maturase [Enterobacteriaceae]MVT03903.1 anaerobic sulfatase maturase [Raoultella sp. 10-1]PAC11515.1 anaerobic sulfatase maturase [Enterobacter sp. 10-1]